MSRAVLDMARIKLQLDGFEDMLARVQKANGDIDKAARDCMEKSAQILESNLRREAAAAGAETSEIVREVTSSKLKVKAEVGWKLGSYDSDNPSQGYRAMFVEFGTGKHSGRSAGKDRQTAAGANRGSTAPRPFMAAARKKSKKPIHAVQEETLHNIVKELEG